MGKKGGKGAKRGGGKPGGKAGAKEPRHGSAATIARELRDAADPVIRLANSPIVSELIASAMIAGAGALARSPTGKQVAETVEEGADVVVETAEDAGRKGADLASLVAYSVAIAAGEIASRLAAAYERQVGGSDTADQVANAARRAADAAWAALGKDRGA